MVATKGFSRFLVGFPDQKSDGAKDPPLFHRGKKLPDLDPNLAATGESQKRQARTQQRLAGWLRHCCRSGSLHHQFANKSSSVSILDDIRISKLKLHILNS